MRCGAPFRLALQFYEGGIHRGAHRAQGAGHLAAPCAGCDLVPYLEISTIDAVHLKARLSHYMPGGHYPALLHARAESYPAVPVAPDASPVLGRQPGTGDNRESLACESEL